MITSLKEELLFLYSNSFPEFTVRDLKDIDVKIGDDLLYIGCWKWILDKGFRLRAASYRCFVFFIFVRYLKELCK